MRYTYASLTKTVLCEQVDGDSLKSEGNDAVTMLQSEDKQCRLTMLPEGDFVIQKQDPERAAGSQCSVMKRCEYVCIYIYIYYTCVYIYI